MVVFPNAKINIGLDILSRRTDGYHDIETVFYPVGLCDILEIVTSGKMEFFQTGIVVQGSDSDNLCIRARELFGKKHRIPSVSIHLHKIIPTGAGLGGGSSDAAFTLKVLRDMFIPEIPDSLLADYACELGSDCPFFIFNKPLFASGRGNEFRDIDLSLAGYFLYIIHPGIHISTSEAYAGAIPVTPGRQLFKLAGKKPETWKGSIKNGFEPALFKKYPLVKELQEILYDAGAFYASMTGSGSAVYGIFTSEPGVIDCPEQWYCWQGRL